MEFKVRKTSSDIYHSIVIINSIDDLLEFEKSELSSGDEIIISIVNKTIEIYDTHRE